MYIYGINMKDIRFWQYIFLTVYFNVSLFFPIKVPENSKMWTKEMYFISHTFGKLENPHLPYSYTVCIRDIFSFPESLHSISTKCELLKSLGNVCKSVWI